MKKINIVAITESKCSKEGLIKIPNFDTPYELIRQTRKGGGMLVATHQSLSNTCLIEKGNEDAEFITIQFNDAYTWRLILGYGFQEKRTRFFIEIENQIEKCIADGIPFLWIGDCNGKLGSDIITDDINNLTPNGALIKDIVDRKNLKVINGSTKCTGKWTRWLSNGQNQLLIL